MTTRIVIALLAIGCGSDRRTAEMIDEPLTPKPAKVKLAKPDLNRMAYQADSRTLELYPLETNAKWMLSVPWAEAPEAVGTRHAFMAEIDPEKVLVFYISAAGIASPKVSLREIANYAVAARQ